MSHNHRKKILEEAMSSCGPLFLQVWFVCVTLTEMMDTTNFPVVHADVLIISGGFFFSHSYLLALLCD